MILLEEICQFAYVNTYSFCRKLIHIYFIYYMYTCKQYLYERQKLNQNLLKSKVSVFGSLL